MNTQKWNRLGFMLALGAMPFVTQAQQKIGGTAGASDANAYLQLGDATGANKGLLLSRVALTATNAASPLTAHVAGMTVYNTATAGSGNTAVTPGYYYNDGTKWVRIAANSDIAAMAWVPDGNTNGALKTIGTNDNFDLPFETNGSEKMRLNTGGFLGIGTTAPGSILDITNDNKGGLYDDVWIRSYNSSGGSNAGGIFISNARGTVAAPANLQNGDLLGNFSLVGRVNNGNQTLSGMDAHYLGNGTTSLSDLSFTTGGNRNMYIDAAGNVGINTSAPATKLDIENGTTNGAIKIVDGTQGANKVLTSDANGVGTWKPSAVDLYYAPLDPNGVAIPYNSIGSYIYTKTSLTLPPGKWLVSVTMILSKAGNGSVVTTGLNETWWVRSTFSNSSTSFSFSPDINGNHLVSGLLPANSPYALMTGSIVINNTSGANKIYYYWAGNVQYSWPNGPNANGDNVYGVGGSAWGENYITYQRIN